MSDLLQSGYRCWIWGCWLCGLVVLRLREMDCGRTYAGPLNNKLDISC
jgi:hypothetical protein